ncbi:hypothetical protein QTP70_002927, partial [Hemibagrus guttatus]
VQIGALVLYQHKDRGGYIRVARAGRDVPKYDWFDNRLTQVCPLKADKTSIKAEIEWDKKKEAVKNAIIDSITGVNYGSEKQIFTTDLTREFSGSVTESFKFSNSTEIGLGFTFKLLKFADDTTVIGLIQDGDESAYRQEIEQLAAWCSRNNLELNTLKTVEMIVDFRRNTPALPPLTIMNSTVPTVESFRFLGTTISQDLKWHTHIDATIQKAQQRLYFLRQLRKFNLPQELLTHFYSAVIESVLCTSITVWFGSATKSDMRRLQRTVRTAERIIGAPLPTLQELYTSR